MFEYYIMELRHWINQINLVLMNERYFLWTIGSIFLLGIVTKWIVAANYSRLIRKAENMTNPKNTTLRQIKMKFESIKEVNGYVANPMLMVQRHLNKCKVGIIPLNSMNNVINWCIIIIVGISGFLGWELHQKGNENSEAIFYVFTGCFLGFALEMINQCVRVKDRQTELAYVIADFLENSALSREERYSEMSAVSQPEEKDNSEKEEDNSEEEMILNQVIGEFLQ